MTERAVLTKKTEAPTEKKDRVFSNGLGLAVYFTLAGFAVLRLYFGTHVSSEVVTPAVCLV